MDLNCVYFTHFYNFLPATRTRNDLTLVSLIQQFFKQIFYENYFFNGSVKAWNGLPYETHKALLDCEHKNQVKTILNDFFCFRLSKKSSTLS